MNKAERCALVALLSLLPLLPACTQVPEYAAEIPAPAPVVKREEVQRTIDAYLNLTWRGKSRYIMHGDDADGIRVDTPDHGAAVEPRHRCWWRKGINRSMPYKWGGFDTPEQFLAHLHSGETVYAGDCCTPAKVAGGDDVVSRFAAGIDCSGFVSRCWRLPRPYSTRELAALCTPLNSVDALRPGDIMLHPGDHVMMFLYWSDADGNPAEQHRYYVAAEAAGEPRWAVVKNRYTVAGVLKLGYRPYRYRNISNL